MIEEPKTDSGMTLDFCQIKTLDDLIGQLNAVRDGLIKNGIIKTELEYVTPSVITILFK